MGQLTTHVLDTSSGKPAAGVLIEVYNSNNEKLAEAVTNSDGRVDTPLLSDESFNSGSYTIMFKTSDYFIKTQGKASDFLDDILIRFNVSSPDQHYHVPLLLSPYGYSTYRGS